MSTAPNVIWHTDYRRKVRHDLSRHNREPNRMPVTATFTPFGTPRRSLWLSPAVRMEIWATILGSEVATVTIALLAYDWSILHSPLP